MRFKMKNFYIYTHFFYGWPRGKVHRSRKHSVFEGFFGFSQPRQTFRSPTVSAIQPIFQLDLDHRKLPPRKVFQPTRTLKFRGFRLLGEGKTRKHQVFTSGKLCRFRQILPQSKLSVKESRSDFPKVFHFPSSPRTVRNQSNAQFLPEKDPPKDLKSSQTASSPNLQKVPNVPEQTENGRTR